jgi:hypothetical protein
VKMSMFIVKTQKWRLYEVNNTNATGQKSEFPR